MRYYVYISDSKLEMLYEQVPFDKREKIAGELKINLGLIQTNFKSETVANARHQKIEIVKKHLGKRVGSIGDRASYVYGRAKVAWGPFQGYPEVVYFGGPSEIAQIALVGSMSNCIGAHGCASPTGFSLSWSIIDLLARRKALPASGYRRINYLSANKINLDACEGVIETNLCSIDPSVEIEFFARTVQCEIGNGQLRGNVFIGSPIYVAEYDHQ